ncbi:MAG: hypothetical protein DYG89_41105 [Caldilinea sp. CFX5]|nr:hypothetical protein [Caldilinea sp. CFX5]
MSVAERVVEPLRVQELTGIGDRSALDADAKMHTWAPPFALLTAVALLLIAVAYTGSRMATAWAAPLFWLSYVMILLPVCVRLTMVQIARSERIGLVVVLGLGLYLVKVLYSPLMFTMGDELQHWRTAYDILQTDQLFQPNAILPVSPFFPGLENVTTALITMSGLSIFAAGTLVIGITRLLFGLSLYLFYEEVSGSSRIAGLSALLYMANPHFIFFNSQFGYEALALALAAFTLYVTKRRDASPVNRRILVSMAALFGLGAMIITHHITSFAVTGILLAWEGLAYYWRATKSGSASAATTASPGGIALLSLIGTLSWVAFVAYNVIGYLSPWLNGMVSELVSLLLLESAPRNFFQGSAGQDIALGLQLATIAHVVLILVALPFGVWQVWQRYRFNPMMLTFILVAILYPALQIARLTPVGLAIVTRATAIVFIGVAFVLAVGAVHLLEKRQERRSLTLGVATWCLIIFVGAMASVVSAWRLPGPAIAGNYSRSLDMERVAAAEWSRERLGTENRFAAPMEHPSIYVLGSYGEQRVVTNVADKVWLQAVYSEPQFTDVSKYLLRRGQVTYLWEDTQASKLRQEETVQPSLGILEAQSTKYDTARPVDRIFDSGAIIIYNVDSYNAPASALGGNTK